MGETTGEATLSELGEAALAYVGMGLAVVPLRARSKEPATRHGLRDWTDDPGSVRAIWSAHPDLNVGVVCGAPSGGLLVIDLDEHEGGASGWESLREWEREHGALPATASAVTGSGGYHLWYRCASEVRPSVNAGLAVDVRGEGSYVVAPPSVHPSGRRYEWEEPPGEAHIAEADGRVLAFVAHARPAGRGGGEGGRYELPATVAQGGRNDAMYRFGASLRSKGLPDAVIADAMRGVNATRMSPPLGAEELGRTVASVLALPPGHSGEFEAARASRREPAAGAEGERDAPPGILNGRGRVVHNRFARLLIEEDHACRIGAHDGAPAVWDGSRYEMGWDAVDRAITRHFDGARMAEKREVRDYVRLMAPVRQASDPRYIAFRNGVIDVMAPTGPGGLPELRPMGPDMVITNVIPHDYDPDADVGAVVEVLDTMSEGDPATMSNLMEVVGVCMHRSNEFAQCPVLLGSGSNGKSVFLRMLSAVLGPENYSSLDVNMLGRPFQLGQLAGRLANIGDDISNEFVGGDTLAIFKKVATGEECFTDVKNASGFKFRPYCTMVFSANEFPKIGDSSGGVMRRLFPIEFRHTYSPSDPGYDPRVASRMTTEGSCRALIVLGVMGLLAVIARNGFTPNGAAARLREEIRLDNDTVAQWIREEALDAAALEGRPTAGAYAEYAEACRLAGGKPVSQVRFGRRVCAALGMATASEWVPNVGKTVRLFRSNPGE